MPFYRTFSEKKLTKFGGARRGKVERARFGLVASKVPPPADFLEVGPGQGAIADLAREAGYRYRAIEASELLIAEMRGRGIEVQQAFTPPFPEPDLSFDIVYADQVLEHMSGIDAAREFVAEAHRVLRPGGVLFVVVPDYLAERGFFWDIDYTHNFVTTERRVKQLFYDGGFETKAMVRSIGAATGFTRDLLAAGSLLARTPGLDALSRYTGTEDLLFRVRKNFFATLEFVAVKTAE